MQALDSDLNARDLVSEILKEKRTSSAILFYN